MSCTLRFFCSHIDVSQEAINPRSGIPGEALLDWLLTSLAPASEHPRAVAAGWEADLRYQRKNYHILVSGQTEEGQDGSREWLVQLHRRRGWLARLLGLGKMKPGDPLVTVMLALLQQEPGFYYITAQHS